MSLPAVIDIEAMLAPISEEQPAGVDPRESSSANSPYYRIKDARNAARAEERSSVDVGLPTPEAWNSVVDIGIDLLTTKAKDLEVASWLTEALIRTDGFAGLRDGLTLIARLVETDWERLYPVLDDDGIEGKVSSVAGLSGSGATGTLDRPIRNIALTAGADASYSFWNYEQAVELEKVTDDSRRAARIKAGTITLETFRKSVAETPTESLRDNLVTIGECETALARMSAALDQVAALDSPSVTALQELLAAVAGCLRHVASDRLTALAAQEGAAASMTSAANPAEPATAGEAPSAAATVVAARKPGEFSNREEALMLLAQLAAYFRRTEPQAPISYTIEDAVRRARMTLPELLKELAQDPAHMQHMLLVAGIKIQEPG